MKSRTRLAAASMELYVDLNIRPYFRALMIACEDSELTAQHVWEKIDFHAPLFSTNPLTEEKVIALIPNIFRTRLKLNQVTSYDFRLLWDLFKQGVEFDESFQKDVLMAAGEIGLLDFVELLIQKNPNLFSSDIISPILKTLMEKRRLDLVKTFMQSKVIKDNKRDSFSLEYSHLNIVKSIHIKKSVLTELKTIRVDIFYDLLSKGEGELEIFKYFLLNDLIMDLGELCRFAAGKGHLEIVKLFIALRHATDPFTHQYSFRQAASAFKEANAWGEKELAARLLEIVKIFMQYGTLLGEEIELAKVRASGPFMQLLESYEQEHFRK